MRGAVPPLLFWHRTSLTTQAKARRAVRRMWTGVGGDIAPRDAPLRSERRLASCDRFGSCGRTAGTGGTGQLLVDHAISRSSRRAYIVAPDFVYAWGEV